MAHILSTLVSLSVAYTQGHGIRNVMEYNIIEVLIVVVGSCLLISNDYAVLSHYCKKIFRENSNVRGFIWSS